MELSRRAPTASGPKDRFTGDVYVDRISSGGDSGVVASSVRFTPGAHTAWHSHSRGQTLHCTDGLGLVVTADKVIVLRPGDTVWTPPNERHWHGAVADRFMTHLALLASDAGQQDTTWQELVRSEEYISACACAEEGVR